MNEDNKTIDTSEAGSSPVGEPRHSSHPPSEAVGGRRLDTLKKALGVMVAVVSLGSVALGLVRAELDMTERGKVVSEKLAAGRQQARTGDYPQAWDSFQEAARVAAADGPIARLLGGSARKQEEVRRAQEDLGMEWLRKSSGPEGHTETTDRIATVLATDVATASGARKADLLAHIGWADFLKQREGQQHLDPATLYRQAIAVDPGNPYAHAFWGHWILWTHGSVTDAMKHYAVALASGRDRATVREFELAGLSNDKTDEADATWWRVVDEMRKAGEPIDEDTLNEMRGKYYFAFNGSDQDVAQLYFALPPAEHVELLRLLLKSPDNSTVSVKAALATVLEAAGKPEQAIAAWHDAAASVGGQLAPDLDARMKAAIKRLTAAVAARKPEHPAPRGRDGGSAGPVRANGHSARTASLAPRPARHGPSTL